MMSSSNNTIAITRKLSLSLLAIFVAAILGSVEGFASPRDSVGIASATAAAKSASGRSKGASPLSLFSTTTNNDNDIDNNISIDIDINSSSHGNYDYEPVFDFSVDTEEAVSSFDRIDDAIMGGISTSSIRSSSREQTPTTDGEQQRELFASWSGVCRTDGGGFCGTRTLPFKDGVPLNVAGDGDNHHKRDGFYLRVRLTSDNEPERRVWKLTTRVENVSRSEQLYQAMFEVPKQSEDDNNNNNNDEWKTIRVPFESFVQVRGPRIVENGPPLDVSGGLFQIGMTMSKFQIATNTTEFSNFRPGYFELQIREIGVYTSTTTSATSSAAASVATTTTTTTTNKKTPIDTPQTLTKKEAEQKKPMALKIIFPILKLFFNEKRSRQKSATKILKKRGLGPLAIARFGFRRKVGAHGIVVALAQTLVGLVSTVVRLVAFWTLKIAIFYPLVAIRRTLKKLTSATKKTDKQQQQTA